MTVTEIKPLLLKINSLTFFNSFKRNFVFKKLIKLLHLIINDLSVENKVEAYGDFIAALYSYTYNLSDYVWDYIKRDMNVYLRNRINGKPVSSLEDTVMQNEMNILQQVSDLDPACFKSFVSNNIFLPEWQCSKLHLRELYTDFIKNLSKEGYGLFVGNYSFYMKNHLHTINSVDDVKLENLYGYESQHQILAANTEALLHGKKAANTLLYGDSGTGKSSAIKAIANKYHPEGLRLIEIDRNYLHKLSKVMNDLSNKPLKFILFLDDLSFVSETRSFSALKIALEGSLTTPSENIAIYATSNRRHLIKESFFERSDDDIHSKETIQQLTALSQRFGLQIYFPLPNRNEYLNIINKLAKTQKINMPTSELFEKAEAFAIKRGGRSPRIAEQFIHQAGIGII